MIGRYDRQEANKTNAALVLDKFLRIFYIYDTKDCGNTKCTAIRY